MGRWRTTRFGLIALLCCIASPVWAGQKQNPFTGKPDYTGVDTQLTDCTGQTTEGRICWDTDSDTFCVGTGSACTVLASSSVNSFTTIDVPAGTDPVADSSTDTLTITETSFLTITGTESTDLIDITQVTTDLGTDGLIAANAVALTTDTTGNYVEDVTAGVGLTKTSSAGEAQTVDLAVGAGTYIDINADDVAVDATEIEAVTFGAGGNASNLWTLNLSGTDPTLLWGSDAITWNADDHTFQGPSPSWLLDPDAGDGIGGHCDATTSVCFIGRQGGNPLLIWGADNVTHIPGLVSCNTIDSGADGRLRCGTDETAAGGAGDITDVDEGTAIDVTNSTGPAPVVNLDLTELSSATLGAGAFTTLTFDAGATDPVLTASSGELGLNVDFNLDGTNVNYTLQHTGGDEFGLHTEAGSILTLTNTTDGVRYLEVQGDHRINLGSPTALVNNLYLNMPSGAIPFIGSDNRLTQDNGQFAWDSTLETLTVNGLIRSGTAFNTSTITGSGGGSISAQGDDASLDLYTSSSVSAANSSALSILRSRGTTASPQPVLDGDRLGAVTWHGRVLGGWGLDVATISVEADGETGSGGDLSDIPTRMLFFTTPDGSDVSTERMRIDDAGNVGINVTPTERLHVSGDVLVADGSPAITLDPAAGSSLHLGVDTGGNVAFLAEQSSTRFLVFQMGSDYLSLGDTGAPITRLDVVTSTTGDGSVNLTADSIGRSELAADAWPDEVRIYPLVGMLPLEAADSIPPIAKDTGTNLDQLVVDFDASTDECRTGYYKVHPDINTAGTVTLSLDWYSDNITTGNVVWDFRHNSGVAQGVDPDQTLTTVAARSSGVQATAGQLTITTWSETVSNLGWVANDQVDFVVCRDANNAGDSFSADARARTFTMRVPRSP